MNNLFILCHFIFSTSTFLFTLAREFLYIGSQVVYFKNALSSIFNYLASFLYRMYYVKNKTSASFSLYYSSMKIEGGKSFKYSSFFILDFSI